MIGISILGATGSVGVNTLDVLARYPERYKVVALTAHSNVDLLFQQCQQCQPILAVMSDANAARQLQQRLRTINSPVEVAAGSAALEQAATLTETDYVMAAIVGAAGLPSTLAAAQAGKRILLANKEALVMAGSLFLQAIKTGGAELLPVDSEHNALFQSLPAVFTAGSMTLAEAGVSRLILTASGGPFLNTPLSELNQVTPAQACAHPNWDMGQKISVDSATMMNKGLEIIEACYLFGAELDQLDVVIHPESIIHSLVQYQDGSVLAQLGNPDMRTPIAHTLAWPNRIESGVAALDLCAVSQLNFLPPDEQRFPCLRLARQAYASGGTAPTILNAANEVSVAAFLQQRLGFDQIARLNEQVLQHCPVTAADTLDGILQTDARAREYAEQLLG